MNQPEYDDNIYRIADELHIPERRIMDFSVPVNPLGVSKKVKAEMRKHLKYLHRYPDSDTKRIRKRLGQFHAVDPETILCGNGSTEIIYLTAKALSPQKVLVPAPTCSVYERACRMSGDAKVVRYGLKREQNFDLDPDEFIQAIAGKLPNAPSFPDAKGKQVEMNQSSEPFDMAFLCNPNNPTGRFLEKQAVRKIADAARDLRCYLVVDEAHIDFNPGNSMTEAVADNPYLFVLRSMSYSYGLAGIRFGYAVSPIQCIARLRDDKMPWMVNSLAQRAALAALKDKAYRKESMKVIQREKAYLEKSFRKLGIAFSPSDANFYLIQTAAASETCRRLRGRGILVRDFTDFAGLDSSYMGISVKSHRENTVLIRELAGILTQGG